MIDKQQITFILKNYEVYHTSNSLYLAQIYKVHRDSGEDESRKIIS